MQASEETLMSNAQETSEFRLISPNRLAGSKILIVDDSRLMLNTIERHLRNHGFSEVLTATDGQEGLRIAADFRPDLVLTDLQMPNMDGYELCQRMRADAALAEVPILVMASMERTTDRSIVFSAGATDLLAKPIDRLELIGRMRVHLDRRSLILRLSEYQRCMDTDLQLARSMQETLMPSEEVVAQYEAAMPVEIGAHYEASQGLGGDLWGLIPLADGKLKIYSADFTGHGVGSALNTFRLHTFISNHTGLADFPAAWLGQLNSYLCSVLSTGQFATMFCAVVDFEACELRYASAGAPPQLLQNRRNGAGYRLLDGTGFPLGLIEQATFEEHCERFDPGCGLLLYSDALVETPDPPEEVFTPKGLSEYLNSQCAGAGAKAIPACIVNHLKKEAGHKLADDLTVISLRHVNKPECERRLFQAGWELIDA